MKYNATLLALAVATVASARELSYQSFTKRDVPQEHSYDAILRTTNAALKLNNPLNIQDAVFGLLDNAKAVKGAGQVTNLDCLQQIVADQAFTNAKAAGDLDGQVNAVLFRALERETSEVGLASAICNETAQNPEIAAVTQHQDPASAEGKAKNKDVELAVAKVLKGLGADPLLALDSATSLPGDLLDATALNLLTPAVTEDEILAAVGGDDGLLRRAEDDTCEDDGTTDDTGSDAGDDDTCEDDGTPDDAGDEDTCEDDGTDDEYTGGNTKATVNKFRREASKLGRRHGGLDFGSCGTPQIQFAKGLDGREEESFQPVNRQDFDHESALNIQVVSEFVCQKLEDSCQASAEAVAACYQASSAASVAEGQEAAFLFNAALGV